MHRQGSFKQQQHQGRPKTAQVAANQVRKTSGGSKRQQQQHQGARVKETAAAAFPSGESFDVDSGDEREVAMAAMSAAAEVRDR